jgi:L-malate glycosyltransferase
VTTLEIGLVCFSSMGGSGTVAADLAHAMAQRGHRVTVFADKKPHRLQPSTAFWPVTAPEHPVFPHPPYTLALASALVAATRARPIDILHLHYGVPHAASAMLARHTLGDAAPATVVTLHGSDVITLGADEAFGAVTGACLRSLDGATTPSAFLQAHARSTYGVDAAVVPNFVDPSLFRREAARPALLDAAFGPTRPGLTLVHVSNFRPVKATLSLVPLMVRLAPQGARLVLIGEGPDRPAVEAEARAAGIADALHFVDPPSDAETLAGWVAACDAFVLPSELESFGLAALEALACGVPVVARRVGGLPEVVQDGVTGLLVDEVEGFGVALETLAAAPATRRAMGTAAAVDARHRFSPDAVLGLWQDVYRRAAKTLREHRAARSRDEH